MYKYFFHSVISIHNYIYGESVLFFFLYTGVLSWKQLGYSLLFHLAFYLTWYYKHFFIQPQSSLLLLHFPSPGNNTGVHSHSLLQGIFPTQQLNTGLLHCRQILCCLSHQGSSRIWKWVAYPFSRGSSRPRNQARVSCTAGGFFTS